MHSHSIRLTASTAALLLFLAAVIYLKWQWLALNVPGAVLIWIGLVMPAPSQNMRTTKKLVK
jgi:hypothetical protein